MNTPTAQFSKWFEDAKAHPHIIEPTAMTLATVSATGNPRARIVLLKDFDDSGFVFYTNHTSAKGRELLAHPHAALIFYWMPLTRQVRIEGNISVVSDAEADAYFASRVRGKQIGAWASLQSQPLDTREALHARIAMIEKQYEGKPVPRPPHWSGFRLSPTMFEFWSEGEFRLHERDIYTADGSGSFTLSHLYP
jgi:pyridoxamine 5'-phosphate oxidase